MFLLSGTGWWGFIPASWLILPMELRSFVIGQLRPRLPHLFGVENRLQPADVFGDGGTDDEVIESFPLGNLLPGHTQALGNDRGWLLTALLQPGLEDRHRGRREAQWPRRPAHPR